MSGSGGIANAKKFEPQTGEETEDSSMNSVTLRNTRVINEATNLFRADKISSSGAGLL